MTHDNPARPFTDAPDIANALAEQARALNHALFRRDGLSYPGAAYDVVSGLSRTAERLPQGIKGVSRFLGEMSTRGLVRLDSDGDPAAHVARIRAKLQDAVKCAHALDDALNAAFGLLGRVGYEAPPEDAVPDVDPDCRTCHGTGRGWYQARDGEFVNARCSTCRDGRVGP